VSTPAFWQAVEAIHDPVYFSPRAAERYTALGLKGFWMGYFASRSAAVGTPGPNLVTALFHGFAPAKVARALPDAWALARPDAVLEARSESAREALEDLMDGDIGEVNAHLSEIKARTIFSGKPLAAAHALAPGFRLALAAFFQLFRGFLAAARALAPAAAGRGRAAGLAEILVSHGALIKEWKGR